VCKTGIPARSIKRILDESFEPIDSYSQQDGCSV